MGEKWLEAFREKRLSQREIVKWVGSLPLIRQVSRKLGIRAVVDRLCPIREVADYTHGEIVEILVANRLTSPQPLYAVNEWAQGCAAGEMWQVDPVKLNDDRLARTLDAISEHLVGIQGAVAVRAIREYDVKVDQVHVDITSFLFDGVYDETHQDGDFPQVRRGYNAQKDYRRKQVRTGIGTTGDGNIPLFHHTFDGNRTDTTTLMKTVEFFEELRLEAQVEPVVYVGDSKLVSKGNLAKLLCMELNVVAPGERDAQTQKDILGLDPEAWTELSYASETELKKRKSTPKEEWNRFWGQEAQRVLELPLKGKQGEVEHHPYRVIFIRSAEEERAARKNRERQMAKTDEDLARVQRGLSRYYKDVEHVKKKVHEILRDRRVSAFYHTHIENRDGQLLLEWCHNREALEHEERIRGRYVLLTNLPAEKYNMDDVLRIQKSQYRVEHRFSHWKGPVGVCPMFLKTNRRIAAMVMVTALALMIFSLIEREVRRKLGDKDGYTQGFLPENRRSRPTGGKILLAVSNVQAIVLEGERRIDRVLNIGLKEQRVYDALEVKIDEVIPI